MNTILRLYQVWNAMKIIHSMIPGTGSWIPTLRTRIRMRVKLADNDPTYNERRAAKINGSCKTSCRTLNRKVARGKIHENPSSLFMPLDWVICLRIDPRLCQCLNDNG